MTITGALLIIETTIIVGYAILSRWRRRILMRRAWYEVAEEIVQRMRDGQRYVVVTPPRGMPLEEAQAIVDEVYARMKPPADFVN